MTLRLAALSLAIALVAACGSEDETIPVDAADAADTSSDATDTWTDVAHDWVGTLTCADIHAQVAAWAADNAACSTDSDCAVFVYGDETGCDCRDWLGDSPGLAVNASALPTLTRAAGVYDGCDIHSGVCDLSTFVDAVCEEGVCVGVYPPTGCMEPPDAG